MPQGRGPRALGLDVQASEPLFLLQRTTLLLSYLNIELLLESSVRGQFLQLSLKTTGVDDGALGMASVRELL